MKKAVLALAALVLTSTTTLAPAAFATPYKPRCPMESLENMPCPPDDGTDFLTQSEQPDPFGEPEVDPADPVLQ